MTCTGVFARRRHALCAALALTFAVRRQTALHQALDARRESGRPLHEFAYDWQPLLDEATNRIRAAQDRDLPAALFAYLDLGFGAYGADLDPEIVGFYARGLEKRGLRVVLPTLGEQDRNHHIIYSELIAGPTVDSARVHAEAAWRAAVAWQAKLNG